MKQSAIFFPVLGASRILLAYIKVGTGSDQTTCLSSSHCIMLFFVNVYNKHYVTQYVGGELSHPACALKVCL